MKVKNFSIEELVTKNFDISIINFFISTLKGFTKDRGQ